MLTYFVKFKMSLIVKCTIILSTTKKKIYEKCILTNRLVGYAFLYRPFRHIKTCLLYTR